MRKLAVTAGLALALAAASAIGDDALQRKSQGQVVPDSFTHGTSAQRQRWFDKGLKRRAARHGERMLVLSPNPEHVARLPGGKIPCRKDFKRYHQRDAERLRAWRAGLDLSERIADEFRDMVATGTIMSRLQPL